ncbi:IclR family transcriptional regulator [Pusillimonas sp. T7-7]|uniref:helix-turn-helix domain-containing protein n=1 Tax=Pusillimonas sp. (strain T7-7) TaxID=1007105 RepID=UPI0002084537|nr:helix-turn-helix domain-containing protein [Pusillimonas sp. T7-7]AEC22106.1 IclR family transcriptional regulator [Pusillimonas sp. T7-7]
MTGIRSVQRAFQVLRAMNEKPIWSLQELQVSTGLPKSTLHRILLTLQDEHYVRCDEGMYGYYQLCSTVQELTKGVTTRSRLVDLAAPILITTTKRIRWPLSLGVVDGHEIRCSFCTMPYSPYAIRPSSFGRYYGLFDSALGKTYFAFCGQQERRILFNLNRARKPSEKSMPTWREMRFLIAGARRQGYGIRYGQKPSDSSAFAVPVFSNDELLAVLCYSAFSGSLDEVLLSQFLPVLKETAAAIGLRWGEHARQ